MGIVNYTYNRSTSGGEIITHLINATDGEGLHFDGATGSNIDIASPPNLGTKFSFEFIVQADSWGRNQYLSDFGPTAGSGRLSFFSASSDSYNLNLYDTGYHSFGVKVLDDLKVHHLVLTIDGTAAILYDNGNQVGTTTILAPTVDSATDAALGNYVSGGNAWDGTFYRARFWNKTLSAAEVVASFENASISFADQYGSQTNKVAATADQTWATAQADTGNDANDRATFNAAYVWGMAESPTDISVASNTLTFSTAGVSAGIYYPSVLTAGKTFRTTINVGSVTGSAAFKIQYHTGSAYVDVHTLVAGSNIVEFTPSVTNGNFFIASTSASAGTLALNATSISNELVASGCVADYDLAFANPTQSLMVQDRAGAADGTSSATGVSQITKLEQVNTNKLSVGGVTPLVGIGLAAGVTPSQTLTLDGPDGSAYIGLKNAVATTGARLGFNSTVLRLQNFEAAGMDFYVNNTNKALSIDSAGEVTTAGVLNVGGNLNIATAAGTPYIRGGTTGTAWRNNANSATLVSILDTGNVGIGKSPNYQLDVAGTTKALASGESIVGIFGTDAFAADKGGSLGFQGKVNTAGENSEHAIIIGNKENAIDGNDAGYLAIGTRPNGGAVTERLRIDSAGLATFANGIAVTTGGVAFPATQSASADANTLDDYEEGYYTPTLLGSTTDPTVTYAVQEGVYTRIGNLVTCRFSVGTSANTGGAGSIYIGGLPFNQIGLNTHRTTTCISGYNFDATADTYQLAVSGVASVAYVSILESKDSAAWVDGQWSQATAAAIYFNGMLQYWV